MLKPFAMDLGQELLLGPQPLRPGMGGWIRTIAFEVAIVGPHGEDCLLL
jgi:hypothetical protein